MTGGYWHTVVMLSKKKRQERSSVEVVRWQTAKGKSLTTFMLDIYLFVSIVC